MRNNINVSGQHIAESIPALCMCRSDVLTSKNDPKSQKDGVFLEIGNSSTSHH